MEKKKTFYTIFFIFILMTANAQAIVYPNKPPSPSVDLETTQRLIVMIDEKEKAFFQKELTKYDEVNVHHTFKHVFHGFSIEGPIKQLQRLTEHHSVLHSSQVVSYSAHIDESVPFIGGQEVRGLFDQRNHRLTGKGVKIAVIDTGIDYTHRDLERNYRGGYDFVDGDNDPMEASSTESNETLHGTHVAGIIAANGRLKGVAPEAEIIAYRALGPNGMGTSEQVIAAIDKAIEEKVDIINLSLGNTINGPDWPTSLALDRAVELGIIAVTSSGNSGPGDWTVGSPGASAKAISVGASSPPLEIPYLHMTGLKQEVQLNMLQGAKQWEFKGQNHIVYRRNGEEKDFKESVKNEIVLLDRGKITFTEKVFNAKRAGAKAVVIANNVKGDFSGALEIEVDLPVVSISKKAGEMMKNQIDKNNSIRTIYKKEVDMLAPFSSRGPVTHTWAIKPDLVAPGVAIKSTVPNGYLSLHGTSMAAPHVAGACALIKQAHPNWTPEQVKAALMNTATLIMDKHKKRFMPTEQGSGRMNIREAVEAEVLIYPGSLTFGRYFSNEHRTKKRKTVTMENLTNKIQKLSFNKPKHEPGLQWDLPSRVILKPGEKRQVTIGLDLNPSLLKSGIHQQWIEVDAGKEIIKLPYLYVVDEPNYPRVMGFEFVQGDHPDTYRYQVYLPGGAEEVGIAVYDPDTLAFVGFLDWQTNVQRGIFEKEISKKKINLKNQLYKLVVFAKKEKQEDVIEADILLGE